MRTTGHCGGVWCEISVRVWEWAFREDALSVCLPVSVYDCLYSCLARALVSHVAAALIHGCRILRTYLSIILYTRSFERNDYYTSIYEEIFVGW